MSLGAWAVFALFWAVFVTTPGPNAVNCISNGMTFGFRRSLWAVAAILTQASLFLALSAAGVTALIAAAPAAFTALKLLGAGFLVWSGLRTWRRAAIPPRAEAPRAGNIYARALVIAVVNPKSVAGYLAAFSQFIQPGVPIGQQMVAIVPTALGLTTLSYSAYTALGALMGRAAMGAVFNRWVRRGLGACLMAYGVALAFSGPALGTAAAGG